MLIIAQNVLHTEVLQTDTAGYFYGIAKSVIECTGLLFVDYLFEKREGIAAGTLRQSTPRQP
jgi:hypothetical protein